MGAAFAGGELRVGDCREVLRGLADGSARCCVTSPPYWGLRDYGCDGQIGGEETLIDYVAAVVQVFREVRRVLAADGTLWLNMGDTYAGSWGSQGLQGEDGALVGRAAYMQRQLACTARRRGTGAMSRFPGLKEKDLCGLPWRVAFALQADGWWLRSDVIWHKPNPVPESVRDRPTKAHEYVFLLSRSHSYFYDAAAVSEPASGTAHGRGHGVNPKAEASGNGRVKSNPSFSAAVRGVVDRRARRTVWTIPTQPYHGEHYAAFPPRLAEICVLAGSRPGDTILDPFLGSGTVAQVAEAHGRRWIGVEINPDYERLVRRRLAQPWLPYDWDDCNERDTEARHGLHRHA